MIVGDLNKLEWERPTSFFVLFTTFLVLVSTAHNKRERFYVFIHSFSMNRLSLQALGGGVYVGRRQRRMGFGLTVDHLTSTFLTSRLCLFVCLFVCYYSGCLLFFWLFITKNRQQHDERDKARKENDK